VPKVELLWWAGCPSTEKAAEVVRRVLEEEGLDPEAVELREITSESQARAEGFTGSPTIRIDGREVAPAASEPVGLSCRVYRLRDGRPSPTPDPQDIRETLERTAG
jgi:hypothetical protein